MPEPAADLRSRLGIVTDEISQELDRVLPFLREHGLQRIELRCIGGRRVPDFTPGEVEELLRWRREFGIRVTALSPGSFKGGCADRTRWQAELEQTIPATLELARVLDVEHLISFAFDHPQPEPPPEAALEALWQAAETCMRAGYPLLIENEPGFLAGTAQETHQLLERLGHSGLAVNWDPCNSNQFTHEQLDAAVSLLGARIRNVHVKNGRLEPGQRFARCGPLRQGAIDWPQHLECLLRAGYRASFVLETHFETHFEPLEEASAQEIEVLAHMLEAAIASSSG